MQHTTLAQAHKIKTLRDAGLTHQAVADKVGVSLRTVKRIMAGQGLIKQRAMADRMEAFIGGVILGNGNLRAYAEPPCDDNDDGHAPRLAVHPIGDTWENEERVIPVVDTLTLLLAEEELVTRLQDAGIDPDDILIVDHESDVEEGTQTEGTRVLRNEDVHNETWEEFCTRCERDMKPGGNLEALKAKRLETEGAEVNVWAVRDPAFMGWPQTTWHPGLTNDTIYRKRTRA